MPIYEYHCAKCGLFEVTQKITEKPLAHCPTCKGKVKRLISQTHFQLKGSGWYITDYARKGKAPQDKDKKEKAPAAEAKGDGKGADGSAAGEKAAAEKKPAKTAASESAST